MLSNYAQAFTLQPSTSSSASCSNSRFQLAAASANNVVLQPSDHDETAFDSFKVGSARVHRYSRDNEDDSRTEYVMWYHGRSQAMANDKESNIPPLSTGRIGRATSLNGLVWEKDTQGSASEDAEDVTLGLNQESWWGFDTAHVGLGNVLLPMSTPAVLTEGGVYIKYYFGGSHEEAPLADFTDKELPESLKDVTIRGMNMKIGVAVSQDGKTFGRVEGDDPSVSKIFCHVGQKRCITNDPLLILLLVGFCRALVLFRIEKTTQISFLTRYPKICQRSCIVGGQRLLSI